jgi:hypothetical protein
MVSRRTLLKLGAAGVAAALVESPAQALATASLGGVRKPVRALFDGRHAESRAFGAALAARGVATSEASGDIASLWYDDLKPRLQSQPVALVGLTDRATLFCIEELARDVGLKVGGRIEHTIDNRGLACHQATGMRSWLAAGRRLGSTPGFGRAMASLLVEPTLHERSAAAQKRTGPFSPERQTTLVSWWIS